MSRICWICGEPGVHGTVDKCLAALRRARAEIYALMAARSARPATDAPVAERVPVVLKRQVLVRRYQGPRRPAISQTTDTLQQAFWWIARYGLKDGRYFIEAPGAPATVDRRFTQWTPFKE